MFRLIKQIFFTAMTFFSCNALKCASMNNQECKIRPEVKNINSNESSFYPSFYFDILVNKCSGSCNNIIDPYAKLGITDVVKNMNIKVFNLMSRTNETRHIKWHETCKCKCRLDASVCNDKQCRNNDKCRCECKELIDKARCDKGFIWNSSICECECDNSCDIRQYLDYKNCKCRNELISKLVEEYSENINGNEMIYNVTLNDHEKICNSCTIYRILLVVFFIISIGISIAFIYFYWYSKKDNTNISTSANTVTIIC